MTITITSLDAEFGVDITGVDLEKAAYDHGFLVQLRAALDEHRAVRLRDQRISPKTLTTVTEYFGPLLDIRRAGGNALHIPGHPMIKVISNENDPETGRALGDGNNSAQVWHTDSTTWEVPPSHIAFYCRRAPTPAPATRFLDMIKVYASLPEATKERIRTLRVMHHMFPRQIEVDIARNAPSRPVEDRRVGRIHPLVRRHLPTNLPILYLPVRRDSLVVGWTEKDSRALLDELWDHTEASPHRISVPLEPDDVVIWDNAALAHSRDGWPDSEGRTMWHVSAEGEVPTPRYGERAPNPIGLSREEERAAIAPFMQTIPAVESTPVGSAAAAG
ncbi:putative Taurine dioxygenase [Frankia canadensis]|uniref:Putative Taurine dioxygenase n=1 Tax=Frankia canadensis TaxID=1836972 RepID=A0A2I2KRT5_9ACTN|nr:TauD/TfdA family dioxygenase [Frankia canadensis]SNQ48359.1 putative Taurine dioxygenase [Frankia canadensis]SOU55649.1 putative Taurine dioxygenase [Frankia canadensis]